MQSIFKFNLGDEVKDIITGFRGVIDSRTQWLNGCTRYGVQPSKLTKDGNVQDARAFDEQQLQLVKAARIAVTPLAAAKPGGPMRDPRSPVER